jgi:hypothetical protein
MNNGKTYTGKTVREAMSNTPAYRGKVFSVGRNMVQLLNKRGFAHFAVQYYGTYKIEKLAECNYIVREA